MTDSMLVLVTPSDSYRTAAHVEAAVALGVDVTVVTDAPVAVPGSAVVVDFVDPDATSRAVAAGLDRPPDGVIGTDGPALVVAASLVEHFGLTGSPPSAVAAAGDKLAQRMALDRAGIPQPEWRRAEDDGASLVDDGPVVVKPVDRSGGQGVIRADSRPAVAAAGARIRRLVGPEAPILVEWYIDGPELAVDGLLVSGRLRPIALFDKPDPGSGPFFAETMLIRPAPCLNERRARVLDVVEAAATAIGLTDGAVHAEVRIGPDGEVRLLELAARSIGGLCGRIVSPGGRPLEMLLIEAALGRDVPVDIEDDRPATGVFMLPVPSAGVLERVDGVDRATEMNGVTSVDITIAPGTVVRPLPEGDRYLGFVFAEGPDAATVEATLRSAVSCIEVCVTPRAT